MHFLQQETLLLTFESTLRTFTRRYLPYRARKETESKPAWLLSQYEPERSSTQIATESVHAARFTDPTQTW